MSCEIIASHADHCMSIYFCSVSSDMESSYFKYTEQSFKKWWWCDKGKCNFLVDDISCLKSLGAKVRIYRILGYLFVIGCSALR